MKNTIIILAFLFSFYATISAQTQQLNLSITESQMEWTGKAAFTSYTLSGTILSKSGQLKIENNKIIKADVIINTKTIDTSIKQLKKHLRSEDFFEVNRYPTAAFELEEFIQLANGEQLAKGWLTIKDKKLAFECPILIEYSDTATKVMGIAKINRTDYGINYNSPSIFASLKNDAIADEFEVKFEFVFK